MPILFQMALFIVSLALLALVILLAPTILQMRRTALAAENFLKKVAGELPPLLTQVKETSQEFDKLALQAGQGMEKVQGFADALADISNTLKLTNRALRSSALRLVINTAGLIAGIKSGASFLLERLSQRR